MIAGVAVALGGPVVALSRWRGWDAVGEVVACAAAMGAWWLAMVVGHAIGM